MARKAGGLAAIMAGQPIVRQRRSVASVIKTVLLGDIMGTRTEKDLGTIAVLRSSGLHIGLVIACMVYIYMGAIIFMYLEHPHEAEIRDKTSSRFHELQQRFLKDVEEIRESEDIDESRFNSTIDLLLNNYLQDLFKFFDNPIQLKTDTSTCFVELSQHPLRLADAICYQNNVTSKANGVAADRQPSLPYPHSSFRIAFSRVAVDILSEIV
ncbi:hypothetical protein RB195_026518 [Necator americanus]|uniref:Potassium channel domain-containing protein n=1 Tax=Necator americanus TaxID=51031 RepID=A0ABR1EXH3_NECAM